MNNKKFAIMVLGWIFVFCEIISFFTLSILSMVGAYKHFQTNNHFTKDEILEMMQESGNYFYGIKPVNFDYDGTPVSTYYLKTTIEDRRYGIFIQEMNSWESAKDIHAEYTYTCLKPGCKGTCGYSIIFGNTVINILPPEKLYDRGWWIDYDDYSNWALGIRLHWILFKKSILK